MSILNYTTTIAVEKTVGEIQAMLGRAKASAVLTEYGPTGIVSAVSFRINSANGTLSFRMPADAQRVYQVMVRDGRVPRAKRTQEQAARVAWRIMKDWLAVQLALIQCGMVDFEQVFLPYMQFPNGQTVYESLKEKRFTGLALPSQAA